MTSDVRADAAKAARLISEAGGEVVGRTKLQKIAFMLEAMGLGDGFYFEYKHYGPYSEDLSSAIRFADLFDLVEEDIKTAVWGGSYSIFRTKEKVEYINDDRRKNVVIVGNRADPVELELAATAILLASEGFKNPWQETQNRKPDKSAEGRLEKAKHLVSKFKKFDVEGRIPVDV